MMTNTTRKKILKIGTNGEIIPPKEIRDELGLLPDCPIILYVHKDQLIIRKLHSLEKILKESPKMKISFQSWKKFKEQSSEEHEK